MWKISCKSMRCESKINCRGASIGEKRYSKKQMLWSPTSWIIMIVFISFSSGFTATFFSDGFCLWYCHIVVKLFKIIYLSHLKLCFRFPYSNFVSSPWNYYSKLFWWMFCWYKTQVNFVQKLDKVWKPFNSNWCKHRNKEHLWKTLKTHRKKQFLY
jgi:hypothetical protein